MHDEELPKDHVDSDRFENAESLERNLKSKSTWIRLLFMLLMMVFFWFACVVGGFIVILQFFWVLFSGETKKEFSRIGRQLARYASQTIEYLTFNTEERPFPFDRDWPGAE